MTALDPVFDSSGDDAELRFERRLAHPPERVWAAVTDPAQLAVWFPAVPAYDPVPGGSVHFTFPGADGGPDEDGGTGEVLAFDPPAVFAFTWNGDLLRFTLEPDGAGTRLVFTHRLGGGPVGRLAAARSAMGWTACLAALGAVLGERPLPAEPDAAERRAGTDRFTELFGLGDGTAEFHGADLGYTVRFARDLSWQPIEEVWAFLTEGKAPAAGGEAPQRLVNGYVTAGAVTGAEPPREVAYAWTDEGGPAGTVRWILAADPVLGTRIELEQSVPPRRADRLPVYLAAWHTHLELIVDGLRGVERCPWPADRTEELTRRYAERLAGGAG
ncbi:SRPBCC family protein [Nocardiopsis coralliicola]